MSKTLGRELSHHEPGKGRIVEYDFSHARVTLTQMLPQGDRQDASVEIEVWPKSGQSAFAVVHAEHARAIGEQIIEMCDQLERLEEQENIIQLPLTRKPRPRVS